MSKLIHQNPVKVKGEKSFFNCSLHIKNETLVVKITFYLSKRTREEAKELIHNTNTCANSTQNDVTSRLGERVQDINYWKFEVERTIQDMAGSYKQKVKTLILRVRFESKIYTLQLKMIC